MGEWMYRSTYNNLVSRLLQHVFEMPTIRLHACCQCLCHCMRPSSFLIPKVASSMSSTNWCLTAGLPPWYTLDFMQHHKIKFEGLNFGRPSRPSHWSSSYLSSFISFVKKILLWLPKCGGAPCCNHIRLCVAKAESLNAVVIHFLKKKFL
jgi:hypothetical protein